MTDEAPIVLLSALGKKGQRVVGQQISQSSGQLGSRKGQQVSGAVGHHLYSAARRVYRRSGRHGRNEVPSGSALLACCACPED